MICESLCGSGLARDAGDAVLQAFALTGQGVAILPDWLIEDDLQAGRLVRLLPEWQLTRQGVYALYPDTRHLPLKVRVFIDFMKGMSVGLSKTL